MDNAKLAPGEIHSYILRLWLEGEAGQWALRFSLTPIHQDELCAASERRGFGSLAALTGYLSEMTPETFQPQQGQQEAEP